MKAPGNLRAALIAIAFCAAASQPAWSLDAANSIPDRPIQVQISQKSEPVPPWVQFADKIAWPLVILLGILFFRKPLANLVNEFGKRGTDINFGSFAIRLPALESQVKAQTQTLSSQQDQIAVQSEHIRNLIRVSMSWYIYKMLYELKKAQQQNGRYIYHDDGSMDRNLRFLIDHGYVEEVAVWPIPNEDICPKVRITQSGEDLIAMRGPA